MNKSHNQATPSAFSWYFYHQLVFSLVVCRPGSFNFCPTKVPLVHMSSSLKESLWPPHGFTLDLHMGHLNTVPFEAERVTSVGLTA